MLGLLWENEGKVPMLHICFDTGQREENSFVGQKWKKEERKKGRERKGGKEARKEGNY